MRILTSVVSLLGPALAGCGDNLGGVPSADARLVSPPADANADAMVLPVCEQYPIPLQASPSAEATAQAELAALAPQAAMTWRGFAGTFQAIKKLQLPLPGCVDGADVTTNVYEALAAHPALFQMDVAEWPTQEFFNCRFADGALIGIGRERLAGHRVAFDVFAYQLAKLDGVVTITDVFGTYLPVAPAAIGEAMTACNALSASTAETTARATALRATTFDLCVPQDAITYTPRANDSFVLLPDEVWAWEEGEGQVLLRGERTLRVTVDPANYTPELMQSSARCPVTDPESNDFTIGFDIRFDIHTGEIVSVKPGLDCIVC